MNINAPLAPFVNGEVEIVETIEADTAQFFESMRD